MATFFDILAQATPETTDEDLFGGVRDFFESTPWELIRNVALLFFGVLWLATAFWVYKDAKRRIDDPWLVAIATLLGLVPPFLGPLIYLFFRPPEYLADVRERELEIRAMEARLREQQPTCPACEARVQPEFLSCPFCATKLKQACRECQAPLEPSWRVCPFCQTPASPTEASTVMSLEAHRETRPQPKPTGPKKRTRKTKPTQPSPSPSSPS